MLPTPPRRSSRLRAPRSPSSDPCPLGGWRFALQCLNGRAFPLLGVHARFCCFRGLFGWLACGRPGRLGCFPWGLCPQTPGNLIGGWRRLRVDGTPVALGGCLFRSWVALAVGSRHEPNQERATCEREGQVDEKRVDLTLPLTCSKSCGATRDGTPPPWPLGRTARLRLCGGLCLGSHWSRNYRLTGSGLGSRARFARSHCVVLSERNRH